MGYVIIDDTWDRFTHKGSKNNDIFTSSLEVYNFNLQRDKVFKLHTDHDHEIKYSIELAVETEESFEQSAPIEIISGPNEGFLPMATLQPVHLGCSV